MFHPRAVRLLAWMLAALSFIAVIQAYRYNRSLVDTAWTRFREHNDKSPDGNTFVPAHEIPSEFLATSDYQSQCKQYYGIQYLENTARQGHEFCKAGRTSSLVCFHAKNRGLAGPSGNDPLCVARGARISSAGHGNALSIGMSCTLRNFTQERLESEEAAMRLLGLKDVEHMPNYFFDTGAGVQLREWHFGDDTSAGGAPACTAEESDGRWYLLARREGNNNIWHKLMEIWQAALSVNVLWMARDPATGQPLLTQEERDGMHVVFEDDREEYLDGLWTIVTGNAPLRRRSLAKPLCPGGLVLPLAGSSSPFWSFLFERDNHETCAARELMTALVARVFHALGIVQPRRETDVHFHPVVTIIDRKKTRVFQDLDAHVALVRERHPNVTVNVVDFATISLDEQVALVQSTDVLVGHHGAGMTHVLFLPPGAAVVEIFPPARFGIAGFRHVAFMRGLTHFVGHSVWKEEWDALVNGVPLPADWNPPDEDRDWQGRPVSYVLQDDFVGLVEAAIRSQQFKSPSVWE